MARTPEEYKAMLSAPEWLRLRRDILIRDKYRCQKCGHQSTYPDFPGYKKDIVLNVHHTKYIGDKPWETPAEFLITLCEDCHSLEHMKPDYAHLLRTLVKKFTANV